MSKGIPTWDIETNTMRYRDRPMYYGSWREWFEEGRRRIEQAERVKKWRNPYGK